MKSKERLPLSYSIALIAIGAGVFWHVFSKDERKTLQNQTIPDINYNTQETPLQTTSPTNEESSLIQTKTQDRINKETSHINNLESTIINTNQNMYYTDNLTLDNEEVLLARMIFGEARECSEIEKIAVAYTALNRINDGKRWNGTTLKDVLLKPHQYSCFNNNDSNRLKLMNPENFEKEAFYQCLQLSRAILNGNYTDPTNGATHYFNPDHASPPWAYSIENLGSLETPNGPSRHKFYREN